MLRPCASDRPLHSQALTNHGAILIDMRRFDEALASYDKALATAPDAQTFHNRGIALHALGVIKRRWRPMTRPCNSIQFAGRLNSRGSVLRA